ncbi:MULTISPECIES: serine hydrolase domain-containing protein [Dyella]|uniref:Class A beta-lactamase-related serine hydrolase n=2 Tax=Dyella TaxID=231454 RepID=A0A4R0YZ44_9GAMM|nr:MULTISPECIES: serine hydrolase domain-containing protein [Dyella]TBR40099.1 class A beta-lactamase-related serine hydrolase [Dyella terrae]TCI12318.1 class A beta-lactamase-related serine hydrolase [Dyella soli]
MRVTTYRKAIAALLLCLAMPSIMASPGTATSDRQIRAEAQALLDRSARADGPGYELLIARDDQIVFHQARGSAQIELGVPLHPGQIYRIASITKMFTAVEVLHLAEAGKLSLDDTLETYVPNFPNGTAIHIRQLLNHTAGVSDHARNPTPGFFARNLSTTDLVAAVADRDPAFAPGAQMSYSNGGYILLGAIIEKVTGKPWHVAIRDDQLAPQQLTHTAYGDTSPIVPDRVAGYSTDNPDHNVENASFISASIPAAAGALDSNADDLFHWMRALQTGKLISSRSLSWMSTPTRLANASDPAHPYGMGMYLWKVRGQDMIGHTGQINGFASALAYLPKEHITIVVLANDDEADARTMARRLAAIALGQAYETPVEVPLSTDAMRALEGNYRMDATKVRTLTVTDGRLFAQVTGRHAVPLQATANGRLYFKPDELSYFLPVRNASGQVTRLDYFEGGDGPAKALPRVASP